MFIPHFKKWSQRQENNYIGSRKWHHILIKNHKTYKYETSHLYIKGLTSIFLNNVDGTFNSHLYHNNNSLKYESIHYTLYQVEALSSTYTCISFDTHTMSHAFQRESFPYSNHRLWYPDGSWEGESKLDQDQCGTSIHSCITVVI